MGGAIENPGERGDGLGWGSTDGELVCFWTGGKGGGGWHMHSQQQPSTPSKPTAREKETITQRRGKPLLAYVKGMGP